MHSSFLFSHYFLTSVVFCFPDFCFFSVSFHFDLHVSSHLSLHVSFAHSLSICHVSFSNLSVSFEEKFQFEIFSSSFSTIIFQFAPFSDVSRFLFTICSSNFDFSKCLFQFVFSVCLFQLLSLICLFSGWITFSFHFAIFFRFCCFLQFPFQTLPSLNPELP